ncbi:MAG: LysM peptidoglycan-binding domain-containing protein [Kiritimatiellae bacterium]|nr:LysM peptidoglycan-binding domain-containing protein [Kiritimatiellia bacterium]
MKTASSAALAAAIAAATFSAAGCRTIHGSKPGSVPPAPPPEDAQIAPPAAIVAPAPAEAGDSAARPAAQVLPADKVGTPGTYRAFILPEGEDQTDRSYAVEANGLRGQTGTHVSAPPPEKEPEARPEPAPAGSGTYVVQSGDILGRIAQKHGVSTKALAEANGISDPSKIRVGQKLKIPPRGTGLSGAGKRHPHGGANPPAAPKAAKKTLPPKPGYTTYVVQNGEILGRIAIKFKTTAKKLQEANGITDPTKLRAGQAIYVPVSGAEKAAPPAPAPEKAEPDAPVVVPEAPVAGVWAQEPAAAMAGKASDGVPAIPPPGARWEE